MISSRKVGEWWRKLRSTESELNLLLNDIKQSVEVIEDEYVDASEEYKLLADGVIRLEDELAGVLDTLSNMVRSSLVLEDDLRLYRQKHSSVSFPLLPRLPWEREQ